LTQSGASCSGKTTLAKHLARILSSPLIIHQDDFCPPSELIHIHPVHNVQDWDDPDTSIEWPRLRGFLSALRAKGLDAATEYSSYDYLNSQSSIPISDAIEERWKKEFDQVRSDANVVFVLVDGFIMFYDAQVVDKVDVKVMLRVPKQELKSRRESRAVYALQREHTLSYWC
jgi:nicotinamide/nicotinate riboside kinase